MKFVFAVFTILISFAAYAESSVICRDSWDSPGLFSDRRGDYADYSLAVDKLNQALAQINPRQVSAPTIAFKPEKFTASSIFFPAVVCVTVSK